MVILSSLSEHRFMSAAVFFFFFNDTATTEIYTLSLHDALPIYPCGQRLAPALRQEIERLRKAKELVCSEDVAGESGKAHRRNPVTSPPPLTASSFYKKKTSPESQQRDHELNQHLADLSVEFRLA